MDVKCGVAWCDVDEGWEAWAITPDGQQWDWGAGCVPGPTESEALEQLRAAIAEGAKWLGADWLRAASSS